MADTRFSAADLRAALDVAESWLAANRDGINAINVYPVPDGDTGTNMLLTLRAALRGAGGGTAEARAAGKDSVGGWLASVARAALLGARGNSGVILSQMLRGLADSFAGAEDADHRALARALAAASSAAYAAVGTPVEGTMLTVLREASAAGAAAAEAGAPLPAVLRAVVDEAFASVDRTPTLLPRLRDAGVVDSGGMGVAVILEGLACGLERRALPATLRVSASEGVALDAVEHEGHGYCAEFVIAAAVGGAVDRAALEAELLGRGGESVLVVGDARTVHVHVHMEDPGVAISAGVRAGALLSVKVDNMQAQHEAWFQGHEGRGGARAEGASPREVPAIGLVAVAPGPGIASAFRDLGASAVLEPRDGGKTSAGELLAAARDAGRDHVLLLPNDKDVLMAAEACAREAAGFVTVVPARNAAAGLAAAVYYLPSGDPAAIAAEMADALAAVRCVEVTVSVRDAAIDGVGVRRGDAIAFIDGTLVLAADDVDRALVDGLSRAVGESAQLITVYLGADVAGRTERVWALVQAAHPDVEVQVIDGGQPHYHYLASVE